MLTYPLLGQLGRRIVSTNEDRVVTAYCTVLDQSEIINRMSAELYVTEHARARVAAYTHVLQVQDHAGIANCRAFKQTNNNKEARCDL